jgi:hypothetical protein
MNSLVLQGHGKQPVISQALPVPLFFLSREPRLIMSVNSDTGDRMHEADLKSIKHVANRRTVLAALCIGGVLVADFTGAQAKAQPLSQLINRAGKMRALSQRASKFYVQVTLGVLPDKAAEALIGTQRVMSSTLEFLLASGPPPEVRKPLASLERDMAALNTLLSGVPKKDDVLVIAKAADSMLDSADQTTRAFQDLSKQSSARIVNIAGRQRMLSQRAGRAYFLIASGIDTPAIRKQLDDSREEFTQALATLQAAPISTPSIKNELELARSQWLFYEAALVKKSSSEGLATVATTSERVFEVMDNLTSLYDAALRELLN